MHLFRPPGICELLVLLSLLDLPYVLSTRLNGLGILCTLCGLVLAQLVELGQQNRRHLLVKWGAQGCCSCLLFQETCVL